MPVPGADRESSRRATSPTVAKVTASFLQLPMLVRVGFLIVVAGGVIDFGYHLLLSGAGGGVDRVGYAGHLVTLVGMLVSLVGVFRAARPRP